MASPGMDFVASLNSSFASSAQTFAKSKSAERAEIQKEIDKTDRQINSLTRSLRSSSRTARGGLGALTQLLQVYVKGQTAEDDKAERDRVNVEKALQDLKAKTDAFNTKAAQFEDQFENSLSQETITALSEMGTTKWLKELNADVSENAKDPGTRMMIYSRLYGKLEQMRQAGINPSVIELLEEDIRKQTGKYMQSVDKAVYGDGKPVDPRKVQGLKYPIVDDQFIDIVTSNPDLQKYYTKRKISKARDYSTIIEKLHKQIENFNSDTSLIDPPASDSSQQQKQEYLNKVVPGNSLVVGENDQIQVNPQATSDEKKIGLDLLSNLNTKTYSGFSEAVRGLKVQSGRDDPYSRSLKSEIEELKKRRSSQVQGLSEAPRLSTGKMALLDHPILRVAGFREAPSMRLLNIRGRQRQAPAAAPEAAVAPEAEVAPEEPVDDRVNRTYELPEYKYENSPGVYVIPGIVQKFKRQISRLRNAPDEADRVKQLGVLVDYARAAEDFPDDVKSALGKAYTSIQGYAQLDPVTSKGDVTPEWIDTYLKDISEPDEDMAESVGTVSTVMSKYHENRPLENSQEELIGNVQLNELLQFLGDKDVLGEGASLKGSGVELSDSEMNALSLGSFGRDYVNSLVSEDLDGMASALDQSKNAVPFKLNEDPRYGSYFGGSTPAVAPAQEPVPEVKPPPVTDPAIEVKPPPVTDPAPEVEPPLVQETVPKPTVDEGLAESFEMPEEEQAFVDRQLARSSAAVKDEEEQAFVDRQLARSSAAVKDEEEQAFVDRQLARSSAAVKDEEDQPDPAPARGTKEYLASVRPKLEQAAQREFKQTAPPPISGVDSALVGLSETLDPYIDAGVIKIDESVNKFWGWVDGLVGESKPSGIAVKASQIQNEQDFVDRRMAKSSTQAFADRRRDNFSADVKAQEEAQVDPIDPNKNNSDDIVNAFSGNENMNPELADKIVEVSDRLGFKDPAHLANLINAESGFDPKAKNPNSTATGLIQFIKSSARLVGTIPDELKRMTAVRQMEYVEAYLKHHFDEANVKNPTDSDLLAAVFYPAAIGKGDDYVLYDDPETIAINHGIRTLGDYKRKLGGKFVMTPKTTPET